MPASGRDTGIGGEDVGWKQEKQKAGRYESIYRINLTRMGLGNQTGRADGSFRPP